MYPKHHIIFGFLFSLVVLIMFPKIGLIGFSLIFLSSFLIDVDHYTSYVWRKKDFNFMNCTKWYFKMDKKFSSLTKKQRNNTAIMLCPLHGVEFWLIVLLLSIFVSRYFLFVLTGITFHLLLDVIHDKRRMDRINKLSVIYNFFKYKKLLHIENVK